MFWRNQGFNNPFQRLNNNMNSRTSFGGIGYNRGQFGADNSQATMPRNSMGSYPQGAQGNVQPPTQNRFPFSGGRQSPQMPQTAQRPQQIQMPQAAQRHQQMQMPQQMQTPQQMQMPQQMQIPQQMQMPQQMQIPQHMQIPQIPLTGNGQTAQLPYTQPTNQSQQLMHGAFNPVQANPPASPQSAQVPVPFNGQGADTSQGALNGLKNVGTFMGYPEYTLPEVDLSKIQQPPEAPAIPHQAQNAFVASPANKKSLFDSIKELCQSEKNGSDYYKNLAEKSADEHSRRSLYSIADRAVVRSRRLMEMHNSITKADYAPESRSINREVGFIDGLRLAIREESHSLRNCAELAEGIESAALREKFNTVMLEKLCQINELKYLISE